MINLRKNKKGFTLVELMVVVVIIGILTAIAIPVYSAVTAGAQTKACQGNQRTLTSAAAMYIADKGTHATTIDELKTEGYVAEVPVAPTDECAYKTTGNGVWTCDKHPIPHS